MNQKLHPGNPKVRDIESSLTHVNNQSLTLRARMVLFILEKFLTSKDPKITIEHIRDFMNTSTYSQVGRFITKLSCFRSLKIHTFSIMYTCMSEQRI